MKYRWLYPMVLACCLGLCPDRLAAQTDGSGDATADEPLARRRTPAVGVVQSTQGAVVNISSTQIVEVRSTFGFDRLFEDMFDFPVPGARARTRRYKRTSVGSGFVLHEAGYIVTNAHVVARTAERQVIFSDEHRYDAQIVAIDHERDLAVLKIDAPAPLEPIRLGHSHDLMVGETVIAIGNPLGYQHTVTVGVVSALSRTLDMGHDLKFKGLIQTDASINPGNSGGPLLNVLGELIGVNTAIRGDAQNIGFAIPVDQLRSVLPELLDIERRYGLVTGLLINENDQPCRVVAIEMDSPADRAGVHVGDTLTHFNGQPLRDAIDYHIALIGHKPGEAVPLRIQRAGRVVDLTLTLGHRPKPNAARLLWQQFGVRAVPMTPQTAHALGLHGVSGLVVSEVSPEGPAASAQIKRGDILIQINRHQPQNLDHLGELLDTIKPNRPVRLTVLRIGRGAIYRIELAVVPRS